MKVATLVALLALALPMGASAQHYSNNDLCDDILYSRCDNPVIPSPSEPWDGEQRGDDWSPEVKPSKGQPYVPGAYDRDDADDMLRTIND